MKIVECYLIWSLWGFGRSVALTIRLLCIIIFLWGPGGLKFKVDGSKGSGLIWVSGFRVYRC